MRAIIRPLLAAMFLSTGIGMAGAQTQNGTTNRAPGQNPAPPDQAQPNTPRGNGTLAPQQPQSGSNAAPGSLSRQLNRSGGVIRPPPTHDQGVVSPPNQGTSRTPVIPPPGTPGGNPQVQPK